jgi:hypothetical protein
MPESDVIATQVDTNQPSRCSVFKVKVDFESFFSRGICHSALLASHCVRLSNLAHD